MCFSRFSHLQSLYWWNDTISRVAECWTVNANLISCIFAFNYWDWVLQIYLIGLDQLWYNGLSNFLLNSNSKWKNHHYLNSINQLSAISKLVWHFPTFGGNNILHVSPKAKFINCDRVTSRVGYEWPSHLSPVKTSRWGFTCRRTTLTLMSLERGLCKQVKAHARTKFWANRVFCVHFLCRSRPYWHTALGKHRHFWKFSGRIMHKMSTQFSNYSLKYHTKKAGTLNWGRIVPKIE